MIISRPIYRIFKPVVSEQVFKSPKTSFLYLNMKPFLIQGANPVDEEVLNAENQFQGGYRCTLKIVTPPTFGTAQVSDNHLGFDYIPKSIYWMGKDSFSYSVVNAMLILC